MARDLVAAEQRAKQAYERTRWRLAFVGPLPLVVLVVAAAALGGRPLAAAAFGTLLYGTGVLFRWRGQQLGAALAPGALAGALPLLLAFAAKAWGHVCLGSSCVSLCLPACCAGGALAGLLITRVAIRRSAGVSFFAAAFAVAVLVGALGCSCVGFGGVIGLTVGLLLSLVPGLVRSLVAHPA